MWDEKAGKRTLITRISPDTAVTGYAVLIVAAYLSIVVGVAIGITPLATLIALLTIPMAWSAFKTLRRHHGFPYRLIPANAYTVFLHFFTGLLLAGGYLISGLI